MSNPWVPHILRPDYTWPRPIAAIITDRTPPTPSVSSPPVRRFWGVIHSLLARFSELYCSWTGVPFSRQIMQLPFGLVLKWTERVRIEEVIAMQMARAAGMPVPKVLCYGEHPGSWRPISILMTRLPGIDLYNSFDLQAWKKIPGLKNFGNVWTRCVHGRAPLASLFVQC
ncbi:hypothetical protein PV08_07526 [Exophiala spinifera]|uniref:Aminoglycoside phosphotransferase domain-containing protein n=1 Tax=Exophiala spinifera TaxID=91928 RepID=A0A0D1ZPJ4_9EURO|nr:uncharacterized protein PV08_07526 [Exophiala spinifera]KIW14742.1 hypothetical protein PV08_07526 [Exophiala spinifera]